jgi:hypothetical protein
MNVLPLFGNNIVSILDARDRFLKPGRLDSAGTGNDVGGVGLLSGASGRRILRYVSVFSRNLHFRRDPGSWHSS